MPPGFRDASRRKNRPQPEDCFVDFLCTVTDEELLSHQAKIQADPYFPPSFSEIVDFSEVTSLAISDATLMSLASTHSIFSESSIHVVVAPAEVEFRLARNYLGLAQETRRNLYVVRPEPLNL